MRLEMHQLNRQIGFQSTREVQKFRLKGEKWCSVAACKPQYSRLPSFHAPFQAHCFVLSNFHFSCSFVSTSKHAHVGSSFGRPRLAARVYSQAQAGPDTLVLVESPAKAKKIQAYLGPAYQVLHPPKLINTQQHIQTTACLSTSMSCCLMHIFQVLASYGHVRDLPPKAGSVEPAKDFSMQWQVMPNAHSRLASVASSLNGVKSLVLATDPDREGEAISWHVQQELQVNTVRI